jgi:hypothetical protein
MRRLRLEIFWLHQDILNLQTINIRFMIKMSCFVMMMKIALESEMPIKTKMMSQWTEQI